MVRRKSEMRRIADLRNKRVCHVDTRSTSGYMMPRVMVLRAGFDPNTFFSSEQFSGDNYGTLQDLLGERCDVATVASDSFAYASHRGIATGKLRIVEKSPPLPQGIYCASSRLPTDLVDRLREALLDLDVRREFGRPWLDKDFRLIGYAPVALRDLEAFARDLDRIRRR